MKDPIGLAYPFSVRIDLQKKSQLSYWSRKFSVEEKELGQIIQMAGPHVEDIYNYLQTLKPAYVRTMSYPQVLAQYETFILTTVNGYLDDLTAIPAETSGVQCWRLLLNEAVEEAGRLAEVHGRNVADKLRLITDMEGIAESVLMSVSLGAEA